MSFAEQFLGKNAQYLTFQDVEQFFITEQDENDKLEFKSYHPNEKVKDFYYNLFECICGFLNSSGGLLIWGAPIDKTKKVDKGGKTISIKSCVGELKPIDFLLTKEAFISKVASRISPSPNSIKFFRIENEGKYLYLIEVEQSVYSPHQFEGKYLMRLDASTIAAPHHYVEALFKKITYPNLKGFISFDEYSDKNGIGYLSGKATIYNFSKLQNENAIFYRMVVNNGVVFNDYLNNCKFLNSSHTEYSNPDRNEPVFYGMPLQKTFVLKINLDLFQRHGSFSIILLIAGAVAPVAISVYKIQIPRVFTNVNDFIIEKNENKLAIEFSDEIGLTDNEKVSIGIGRKVDF